jgi:hypothetical protein
MNFDLTLAEILGLLRKDGWHVPTPVDGVYVGNNTVRVRVLDLTCSFVQIERIGPDDFKITPYKDKT